MHIRQCDVIRIQLTITVHCAGAIVYRTDYLHLSYGVYFCICSVEERTKWTLTMVNVLTLCVAVCGTLLIAAPTTTATFTGWWPVCLHTAVLDKLNTSVII